MKRALTLIFLLISVLWTYSQDRTEVIILHLNDMHAKTEGFAKLKYLADSLRRSHPHVFIVSAGDNFTGNPYVDMVSDKGAPMIDLMNHCGFSVSCIGNHEFDLGQDFLQRRITQAKFPFICANLNTGSTGLKQPPPYILLKAGKIEIPVLGLLEVRENGTGTPDTHPAKVQGISFSEPVKTSASYAYLKSTYGNLIALTHLGVETDERLARACPQIDVIIGGHSHTILKKAITENGVLIVQAGSYQRYIGKLTLVFRGKSVESKSDSLIALESLRISDASTESLVKKYQGNPEFERTLGQAQGDIKGKQNLGALMSDAIAWSVKADFAFQNRGGIRISVLKQGNITVGDIYRLDPFGNQVVVYRMNLEELTSFILSSYKRDRDIDLIPSGLTYTIHKGENRKPATVRIKDPEGNELPAGKTFLVATNAYVAAAYTFEHQDPGRTLEVTTADCIIRYLEKKNAVKYKDEQRARLKDGKVKK